MRAQSGWAACRPGRTTSSRLPLAVRKATLAWPSENGQTQRGGPTPTTVPTLLSLNGFEVHLWNRGSDSLTSVI